MERKIIVLENDTVISGLRILKGTVLILEDNKIVNSIREDKALKLLTSYD